LLAGLQTCWIGSVDGQESPGDGSNSCNDVTN